MRAGHFVLDKGLSIVILFLFVSPILVTTNNSPISSLIRMTDPDNRLMSLASSTNIQDELPDIQPSIQSSSTNNNRIPYSCEQNTSVDLTSKKIFSINTSETSNILVESTPLSSSFLIHSGVSEERISWQNDIEPNYGDVEIFKNLSAFFPYYRLNFSENNVTPVSGVTNTDFNVTANPSPCNFSTELLFEYRIPFIDSTLINEIHSLVLELRFNDASLNFIIADKGSYFGTPVEENVYKPGTNSLYILCNETDQSDWIFKNYNITHLITQYFLPSEYSLFSRLETVFCYMFAFVPKFHISLDLKVINYTTILSPNESAVIYTIDETEIQSENGSLKYEFLGSNISLQARENTLWYNYQITMFNIVITRSIEVFTRPQLISWNNTFMRVNLNLSIPQLFSQTLSSRLFITLPLDWILLNGRNSSIPFETLGLLEIPSDNLTGQLYCFSIQNLETFLLQSWVPNYIKNIEGPTIVSYYEKIQILGSLLQPTTGVLHLYLMNNTVFHHDTTICLLNGSFIFSMISIDDIYPLGVITLLINLSSNYQFGIYQQILHIHSGEETSARINLFTPEALEVYQYDPIFLNLSLEKNGLKYLEESTMVILVMGEFIHQLSQSINGFFHLTLNHVVWPPQQSNLTIIASNGGDFFASKYMNITIYPIVVDWDIQGIPDVQNPDSNLSLRVNVFISPQEGGTNWPLSGVDLTIWVNSTLIHQCPTNDFGYADVIISSRNYHTSNLLNLIIIAKLENIILKMNTFTISISNDSTETDRIHPYLDEIMKTSIVSNKSFFYIYQVMYPTNGSQWFVSHDNYQGTPISAFLMRNNIVLEIEVTDQLITWDLVSSPTNNDTLIVEFLGPSVTFSVSQGVSSYDLHIESFSSSTISNYTIVLDLDFLDFPLSKIILRDFLKRDITNKFEVELIDTHIHLKFLNIINGIIVHYYLEIQFDIPNIEILTYFEENYAYDAFITGKWRFTSSSEFSYSVSYTISNQSRSECRNTTIIPLTNNTFIVEAFFPRFKWNSSVFVTLKLNFPNGAISTSLGQFFTIIDPYPPDYSFYLESHDETINLHIITAEPESGSGVQRIIGEYLGIQYNSSVLNTNHHLIELPRNNSQFGVIKVIISDWAGNENSFNIDLKSELESQPMREKLDPSLFLPSLFSLMSICAILAFKFIRKRQSSIL
ncbi:hypothetical protein CEE45_03085 [Candidatus Heimdallarchaeota archaeon B3_Heim]|nr:MAG: hypothetical protein CEE45_03085 [Candidatus Heimdallarchaeota archaeon B3_Heim]